MLEIPSGLLITDTDEARPLIPVDPRYHDLVVASSGPLPINVVAATARLARSLPAQTQERLRLVAWDGTDTRPLADLAGALRLPVVQVGPTGAVEPVATCEHMVPTRRQHAESADQGLARMAQPQWGDSQGPEVPVPVPTTAQLPAAAGVTVDSDGRIRLAPAVTGQPQRRAAVPASPQPPAAQAAPRPQATLPPPAGMSSAVPAMPAVAVPPAAVAVARPAVALPADAVPPAAVALPADAVPPAAVALPADAVPPAAVALPADAVPPAAVEVSPPAVVVSTLTTAVNAARPASVGQPAKHGGPLTGGPSQPAAMSLIRPSEVVGTAARLRDHASSAEDHRQFRASLGWRYDAAAQYVTRLLSDRPVLRTAGDDGLAPDLAAVQFFTNSGDDELLRTVRAQGLSTVVTPLLSCLVSGLRRLPAFVGPVIRGGPAQLPELARYQPGTEVAEPGPLLALTDAMTPLRGNAEVLIWSTSARQLHGLTDPKAAAAVMFLPGTTLRVLGRDGGDELAQLLMVETRAGGDQPDPARDERITNRLRSIASARAAARLQGGTPPAIGWTAPWLALMPGLVPAADWDGAA